MTDEERAKLEAIQYAALRLAGVAAERAYSFAGPSPADLEAAFQRLLALAPKPHRFPEGVCQQFGKQTSRNVRCYDCNGSDRCPPEPVKEVV